MSSSVDNETARIRQIAQTVRAKYETIQSLESEIRQMQSQLANLQPVMDEDGNDMNEGMRSTLQMLIGELENDIRSNERDLREASSRASQLAREYQNQASQFKQKAASHSKAASGLQAVSKYRFGKTTAQAASNTSAQRSTYYDAQAAVYINLAQAARQAAQGIDPGQIGGASAAPGTFQKPGSGGAGYAAHTVGAYSGARGAGSSAGRSGAGSAAVRSGAGGFAARPGAGSFAGGPGAGSSAASGAPANRGALPAAPVRSAAAAATYASLGAAAGIPHVKGVPKYEAFSQDSVKIASAAPGSAFAAAQADAAEAKKMGLSALQFSQYRKENGLLWCSSQDGTTAYLMPGTLQGDLPADCICANPTPQEREAAFLQAHGYTAENYEQYKHNPEYMMLHQQAHPDRQVAEYLLPKEVRAAWIGQVVPDASQEEAEAIVDSMYLYSGDNYSDIHWDQEGKLQHTKNILRVFDSGNVTPYQGEIYRGISFPSRDALIDELIMKQDTWTEPGITSFSQVNSEAEEFAKRDNYGLVLHCSNNKSGIPFMHMAKYTYEREILSPGGHRNQGWRIDYNSWREDKINKIIYLDIIEN